MVLFFKREHAFLAFITHATAAAASPAFSTLYTLPCEPDGRAPFAGVSVGADGALYGASSAGGAAKAGSIFRLGAPATVGGAWDTSTIYSFGAGGPAALARDGANPRSSLLSQNNGTLIGTTYYGNDTACGALGCGGVFSLAPAAGDGGWRARTLYQFHGGEDGANPGAALVAGQAGVLYGTTVNGGHAHAGTVFQITLDPDGGRVFEKILLNFDGFAGGSYPSGPLLLGPGGALYGTTEYGGANGSGTVFAVLPPGAGNAAWHEQIVYNFLPPNMPADGYRPVSGLIMDPVGALYGSTQFGGTANHGTVFKLLPPAAGKTAWTETTLYSFQDNGDGALPSAGLVRDAHGTLFGTTQGSGRHVSYGSVFALAPPPAGQGAWTETTLHAFTGKDDGEYPVSTLVLNQDGHLFGTTPDGGPRKCGVVFELAVHADPGRN